MVKKKSTQDTGGRYGKNTQGGYAREDKCARVARELSSTLAVDGGMSPRELATIAAHSALQVPPVIQAVNSIAIGALIVALSELRHSHR